jgi:hypothetical protein
MPWTIIVASEDGDQLDELMNGAQEIATAIGAAVVPAESVEEVQKRRRAAAGRNQLLILSAYLPGDGSHDPQAALGLELIRSIAQEPDAPPCILVSRDPNHLSRVQEIARCELLLVGCETDYVRDCLRLARRLGVVAPPDAGDTHRAGASQYALLEVCLQNNGQGYVTLGGLPPQPLNLDESDIDDLIEKSQKLAERLNKARSSKRIFKEWEEDYHKLGEQVGKLLFPTMFGRLYWSGYDKTKGNVRVRFNLDQRCFDGAWEAIYDSTVKRHVILGDTITVARRAYRFDDRYLFTPSRSAPAQFDVTDGVLTVVIIEADVPDGSTPEGPSDPLWDIFWRNLRGRLCALPHIKKEVKMLQGLCRAQGGTDKAGQPQPRVVVEVLSPRAGTPLAKIVEDRLKDRTRPYDIIHFAGHALFARSPVPQDSRGYLVFPGKRGEQPSAVPIATFANWLEGSGVQLVYLSCCRSSSSAVANELAAQNVPLAIGFNWDLDDAKAVEFARDFYTELLGAKFKVCQAFGKAQRKLHRYFAAGDPIWAAPVLIAQPDEWTQVEDVLAPKKSPRKSSRRIPTAALSSQTPRAA